METIYERDKRLLQCHIGIMWCKFFPGCVILCPFYLFSFIKYLCATFYLVSLKLVIIFTIIYINYAFLDLGL